MPSTPVELAARAEQWALELNRFQRQEQMQGQLSPTDAMLLSRVQDFLNNEVAPALRTLPASSGKAARR